MFPKYKLSFKKLINSTFFKSSSLTSLVRGGGMFFNLLLSVFISRLISADGLGLINLSNQIINVILMLILLGLQTVIIKETAIAKSRGDLHKIQNIIYSSVLTTLPFLLCFYVVQFFLGDKILDTFFDESLEQPFNIIALAIVFQVFSRIFSGVLNGVGKVWQSSLVNESLSLLIVLVLLGVLYISKIQIDVIIVSICYLISRVTVSLVVYSYWRLGNPEYRKKKNSSLKYIGSNLLKVGLPLLFVQATNTIANSIDTIMIGVYMTPKDVGVYSIAYKLAFVSSFLLQITNAVLSPRIAAMYANNQIDQLQAIVKKISKVLFLMGILSFIVLLVSGRLMLGIWGAEFIEGYVPLLILGVGQFFNMLTGCVGVIISLCGQERAWGVISLISAIGNTLLNIFLIKSLGINGAAIATAVTMISVNVVAVILVKKRIGIKIF